jgi:hypothetical protein
LVKNGLVAVQTCTRIVDALSYDHFTWGKCQLLLRYNRTINMRNRPVLTWEFDLQLDCVFCLSFNLMIS